MSSHSLHLLNKVQSLQEQVEHVKQRYRAGPTFVDSDDPPSSVSLAHDFRVVFEKLLFEWAFPKTTTNTVIPEATVLFVSSQPRKETTR